MLKRITILLLISLFLSTYMAFSQDMKFGKVSKEELEEKFYPLDSSADAAVLYKKRRTHYEYSDEYGWRLITRVHERIKIYTKQGNDWATKSIRLYKDGNAETVSIKAYTYNLSNRKIEKTKLKKDNIFIENTAEHWTRKKFTMPDIKKGSIVEWEYKITSPYAFNINDMVFQYKIPVKYIDTQIRIPEFFVFKNRSSTYHPIVIQQSIKSRGLNFNYKTVDNDFGTGVRSSVNNTTVNFQEKVFASIQENIPAITEEPFINNLNNYVNKTSFEYEAYKPYGGQHRSYSTTWENVTKTIHKRTNFGGELKKDAHFMDDLSVLISNTKNEEKIATIFQFVKNKIKWNNSKRIYTNKGVVKAYKEGSGNVAEINLTLVAMLRAAGIKANPVLVSTRDHGVPLFPTLQGFNYVIAGVELANRIVLLDATETYAPPNVLPLRAINWLGRIIRKDGTSMQIGLSSKQFSGQNVYLKVVLNENGLASGACRVMYSNLTALNYRNNYNKVNNQDVIGKLEKEYQNIEISELKVTNDVDINKKLTHTFAFETDNQMEVIGDKIYFSPMFFFTEKENPFKLENRTYPIDFGTPFEEKFTILIDIPDGYKVESKPENKGYALPDEIGSYRFSTISKNNQLQVLSIVKMNLGVIAPNNYKALQEFYKNLVNKQLEKVVLSKI